VFLLPAWVSAHYVPLSSNLDGLGSERDFACGFGHPANVRSISEIVAGQCGSFWPRFASSARLVLAGSPNNAFSAGSWHCRQNGWPSGWRLTCPSWTSWHVSVRRALRQAWELEDPDKAERPLRNFARRLDQQAPGVAASILEGLDEMLTVNRLGLPAKP
jgi:hypothetical protein